jgi:MFS family permease
LILGLGEAAAQPASLAYIRRAFPEEGQGLPTAVYLTGLSIGPAAGTFLGSLVLAQFGWRFMFIALGLGCCLWLIPWLALAPNENREAASARVARTMAPIDWKALLSRPLLWGIFIGGFFYSYFWYFCLTWLPAYLVMDRKMDFLQMGIYASLPFLAKVPVSIAAGRLSDWMAEKTGRPVLVRKSFVATGFLLGTCILLLPGVRSSAGAVTILVGSLMGVAVASANYWALTQAVTPAKVIGRVIGVQNTVGNMAGICAPIVTGWLISRTGNFSTAIFFAGGALLIASAAYLLLVREKDAGLLRDHLG